MRAYHGVFLQSSEIEDSQTLLTANPLTGQGSRAAVVWEGKSRRERKHACRHRLQGAPSSRLCIGSIVLARSSNPTSHLHHPHGSASSSTSVTSTPTLVPRQKTHCHQNPPHLTTHPPHTHTRARDLLRRSRWRQPWRRHTLQTLARAVRWQGCPNSTRATRHRLHQSGRQFCTLVSTIASHHTASVSLL
jgi:hypothetical protein